MKLTTTEAIYFNNLYTRFLMNANDELNIFEKIDKPSEFKYIDSSKQLELRTKIYQNMEYFIDSYLEKGNLSEEDKELVKNWKLYVHSIFIIYKHLKNHTVFIDAKTAKAYGVLGLLDYLSDVIPDDYLPQFVKATLLPFKGKIIYDGMFEGYNNEVELMDNVALEVGYQGLKEANEMTVTFHEKYFDKEYSYDEKINIWEENKYQYIDGNIVRVSEKIGRNDPCTCGSGKKYKKCCGK
ncbi:MAG: SEC-C metal-binding domain-containing protein [Candidatus Sericytochromatia bacterium]